MKLTVPLVALACSVGSVLWAGGPGNPMQVPLDSPVNEASQILIEEDLDASPPTMRIMLADVDGNRVAALPQPPGAADYAFFEIRDLTLVDLNADGMKDLVVVPLFLTGIGPSGAEPFPQVGVYLRSPDGFSDVSARARSLNDIADVPPLPELIGILRELVKTNG